MVVEERLVATVTEHEEVGVVTDVLDGGSGTLGSTGWSPLAGWLVGGC